MIKSIKKGMALLLALMLVITALPSVVFADSVSTSQYNLTVADGYKSFVVVLEDSIAVLSTFNDEISSADLASALSADGYTVSYAQTDGGADATATAIYSGYVKLTPAEGGDAVYIPIVPRASLNDTDFESMSCTLGDENVTYSAEGKPLGGKTAPSPTFTVSATPTALSQLRTASLVKYNNFPTAWTYEFNMYADGDAVPYMSMYSADDSNYGFISIKYNTNGEIIAYSSSSATKAFATLERGKWHRFAIVYTGAVGGEYSGGRIAIYADGVHLGNVYNWGCRYIDKYLLFGVSKTSGAGRVAFDDLDAFAGAYNVYTGMNDIAITPENTDKLTFDTTAMTVSYKPLYADLTALADDVKTAAAAESVAFFNSDLSAEATSFEAADIAVIKSVGGAYHYYTVEITELTPMEKLGLEEVDFVDEEVADYESVNPRIAVREDCVSVYSHISAFPGRYITSDILLASLKSNSDYTLSYARTQGGEAVYANTVNGGYIRGDKEGEDPVFVPIAARYDQKIIDLATIAGSGTAYQFNYDGGTPGVNRSVESGGKGKAASDKSHKLNVPTALESGSLRLSLHGNMKEDGSYMKNGETTFTYVFNFMADDTGIPYVVGGTDLVSFDAEGYLSYYAGSGSTAAMKKTSYKMIRNRWNQLAITLDLVRCRPLIWLNGEYINVGDTILNSDQGRIGLGISKTVAGTVWYDDVEYYEGYYSTEGEVVAPKKNINGVRIDRANKVISYAGITDVAALEAALLANSDASSAAVYTSEADYTPAAALDNDNNIVVLTSPNGMRYEYYTLEAMDISDVIVNVADDMISASVKVYDDASTADKLYIAAYNGNKLVSVDLADVVADGSTITASIEYDGTLTYKTFLWGENIVPVK